METGCDLRKCGTGKTVLVVDDSAVIRKILAAAFLSDGFKLCAEAENGREGIEAAKQVNPDLIILDLSMPVLNGIEAASQLRKLFPTTPIILFTLYGDSLLQKDASKAGIDLVLMKTMPLPQLVDKAQELMSS